MKYLITLVLFIVSATCFAQVAKNITVPIYTSKSVVTRVAGTTTSKYRGSMGEVGTSYKSNGVVRISYCLNSGNESARKENNKRDTTTYRVSLQKNGNKITITHPNGTLSTITDNGNSITINATGGATTTVDKLSVPNQSGDNAMYMAAYNKNVSEIRTIYGTIFKFKRKANIATITNWDGSYLVMITTGKISVVVDSKGIEMLVINDNGDSSVMNTEGANFLVVNETGRSQIIHNDNNVDNINSFGPLGLVKGKDGKFSAIFNYGKAGTNKDAYGTDLAAYNDSDGGELTRSSFYENTISAASN